MYMEAAATEMQMHDHSHLEIPRLTELDIDTDILGEAVDEEIRLLGRRRLLVWHTNAWKA